MSERTLYAIRITGIEFLFEKADYYAILAFADQVTATILKTHADWARWTRYATTDAYGEELTFCYADIQVSYISTEESRKTEDETIKATKAERKANRDFDSDDD